MKLNIKATTARLRETASGSIDLGAINWPGKKKVSKDGSVVYLSNVLVTPPGQTEKHLKVATGLNLNKSIRGYSMMLLFSFNPSFYANGSDKDGNVTVRAGAQTLNVFEEDDGFLAITLAE